MQAPNTGDLGKISHLTRYQLTTVAH